MADTDEEIELTKTQKDLMKRLNIIEGQVRGIKKMVMNDTYCIDIMKQIKATRSALEKVNVRMLESHMNTCVTTRLRSDDPKEREEVIAEVVDVFNATGKL